MSSRLGAIAYLVLEGRPAAERVEDLAAALRDSEGLDLAAALDGVGPELRQLVRWSTAPTVSERMDSADIFLMALDDAEREASMQLDPDEQADPLAAKPGDRLGDRFVLTRRLGTGSSAAALLVDDEQSGQPRVLKVALHEDRERAIEDEGAVLSAIRHPAIVNLFDTVRLRGRVALVLQWASAGTLAARIREDGPLSLEFLERLGADLLEALRQLERQGYVHRDVKPENLGLVPVGKNDELHLVLMDFSLQPRGSDRGARGNAPLHRPVPGESGRFDPAADRYAAAVTLHEMATARRPVWGDGRTAPEHTTGPAALATDGLDPAVRRPLTKFFERALQRDAAQRFDTAEEMLSAWRSVFARIDAPAGPEHVLGDDERRERIETAELHTPLTQLGLSTAQVAALEQQNVVVVEDLITLAPTQLNSMRGVGSRMRREIARVAGPLRARFSDELVRRGVGAARETTSGDDVELSDVVGLDAIVAQLLPARARDAAQLRIQRALLTLPLGELDDGEPLPGWPAADVVAGHLGESLASVRAAIDAGIRRWGKAPAITAVRRLIAEELDRYDGVAGADELARRVLAVRGAIAQRQDTRSALARAVTRAAIEVELARDTEARITQRRHGTGLLVALRAPTAQALLDDVIALGRRADELAANDPPHAPDTVAADLREHSTLAAPAGMRPGRLLELAAQASSGAAVSPRGELYPVGLAADRALALAQGALVGASELTIAELRGRVAARYPRALPLPDHQHALSTMLHEAGISLDWRTDPARPGGGVFVPSALPLGLTALSTRTSLRSTAAPSAALDPGIAEEERFIAHLDAAEHDGGLLALIAAPVFMRRTRERLIRDRQLIDVNMEAALLGHVRRIREQEQIAWATITETDAARARTAPAGGCCSDCSTTRSRRWSRSARHAGSCCSEGGLLARYVASTCCSRCGCLGPGVARLVAARRPGRRPAGRCSTGHPSRSARHEWTRVPRSWIPAVTSIRSAA